MAIRRAPLAGWVPPEWFVESNIATHGEKGREFVERIPETVAHLSRLWNIEIGAPFANMFQNFVAPAVRQNGVEAVIKISLDRKGVHRQIDALRLFDGRGIIRLFEADVAEGAVLVERALPGHRLKASLDVEASIFIPLLQRLWRTQAPTNTIPSLSDVGRLWIPFEIEEIRRALLKAHLGEQVAVVDQAEKLLESLLSSSGEAVLLHGDVHAGNVLSAKREQWLMIDPNSLVGERAYDIGLLFRDDSAALKEEADPQKLLTRCLKRFANELDLDLERIRSWGLVQAVVARNWRFKTGVPTKDWSVTTKFLAGG